MYSIRRRLIVHILLGTFLVLVTAGVVLDRMIGGEMQRLFDSTLSDKAETLKTLLEWEDGRIEFEYNGELMPEFQAGRAPQYFQVWRMDGSVIGRSLSLGNADLAHGDVASGASRVKDTRLPDGRAGRMIQSVFIPLPGIDDHDHLATGSSTPSDRSATPVTLVLASERVSLDQLRAFIRIAIGLTLVCVLLLIAFLVGRYVESGLSPLLGLTRQIRRIDETDLGARFTHEGPVSEELAPIERALNRLMQRMENAFEREKRFSSDVAHELRTPLAELKTLADVAPLKMNDQQTIAVFFDDIRDISLQMEKLVTHMLELARADAEMTPPEQADIALCDMIEALWSSLDNSMRRDTRLENSVPPDLQVVADRHRLSTILRNLLENAAAHSPPGAAVGVSVAQQPDGLRLVVHNPVHDLCAADLPYLQERFWRKDLARSDSSHSGLGLSLAAAMAASMGLVLRFDLDSERLLGAAIAPLQAPHRRGGHIPKAEV